jgi:hypothetical protein
LRGPLVSLAAEIADGVIGHPIWSIPWLTKEIPLSLARGLKRGGKQRPDVEFNAWLWVAVNDDRAQAVNDARATVAFYAGVGQYEEYFAAHGFREEARRLQEGVKRGDYLGSLTWFRTRWRRRSSSAVPRRGQEEDRAGMGSRRLAHACTAGIWPLA